MGREAGCNQAAFSVLHLFIHKENDLNSCAENPKTAWETDFYTLPTLLTKAHLVNVCVKWINLTFRRATDITERDSMDMFGFRDRIYFNGLVSDYSSFWTKTGDVIYSTDVLMDSH